MGADAHTHTNTLSVHIVYGIHNANGELVDKLEFRGKKSPSVKLWVIQSLSFFLAHTHAHTHQHAFLYAANKRANVSFVIGSICFD